MGITSGEVAAQTHQAQNGISVTSKPLTRMGTNPEVRNLQQS
jgi:hypothetical protein